MDSINWSRCKLMIRFDDSALEPSFRYLRNPSETNLKRLVATKGSRLAYAHFRWVNPSERMTIKNFWSAELSTISSSIDLENRISQIKEHILREGMEVWLNEVLRYLPRKHCFNTIVYLNIGCDNIVFGENIALNLNSEQFRMDVREAIYYLIHELAHAGYVRYHPLPPLCKIERSMRLLEIIRYFTQLEGMGVKSAMRIRIRENGLLDNDYKVLLDDAERDRRVRRYFRLLNRLQGNLTTGIDKLRSDIFEKMSGKKTRLWYITGCHMAQEIEKSRGIETLRQLVRQGSEEFFNTYYDINQ